MELAIQVKVRQKTCTHEQNKFRLVRIVFCDPSFRLVTYKLMILKQLQFTKLYEGVSEVFWVVTPCIVVVEYQRYRNPG